MLKRILVSLLIVEYFYLTEAHKVYNGYRVYDIKVKNEEELTVLKNLETFESEERELDFLSFHNNVEDTVKLMVKPSEQKYIENVFHHNKIDFKTVTLDAQNVIDEEYAELEALSMRKASGISFDRYYRYEEINKYLDSLPSTYKNIEVTNVGKSYEGRDIKVIKITNGDGRKKNSVFIDAGIHAREWIAPASALYLIDQFTDKNSNLSQLLNKIDFVIQPLVNPDGYEFTFNFWRLWRKTRSRNGLSCSGVDANRNYDFHWHEVGSSNNNCAETYHGPKAFSENESTISAKLMNETENCKFFLSFHSYGNYLLYPYGYTNDLPKNAKDNDEVARAGRDAIFEATGTNYTVGSTSNTLYLASGSSIDYAHGVSNIPISIVMELTGGGLFGFDLPPSEIEKVVKETAIGVYAMVDVVADKYPS